GQSTPGASQNGTRPSEMHQEECTKTPPTPSKGNRWDGEMTPEGEQALQFAINNLPIFDTQKVFFRELRDRGVAVPDDRVLRDDPLTSLYFCQMAYKIRRDEARAAIRRETAAEAATLQKQPPATQDQPQAAAEHSAAAA
ncbi:MAG: hypothetical protein ACRD5L_05875, partial [Bryobacteraceae bacterium]